MWILCLAEESHETSSLIFFKDKTKKIKVSSPAILLGAVRINIFLPLITAGWDRWGISTEICSVKTFLNTEIKWALIRPAINFVHCSETNATTWRPYFLRFVLWKNKKTCSRNVLETPSYIFKSLKWESILLFYFIVSSAVSERSLST